MKMIEIQNLTFRYHQKSKAVLDNLTVSFEKGNVHVLLGLNGSGKTTLIKIMAGLSEKYNGQILLKNKNLKDINIKDRAKVLSYVSQKHNATADFLVKDYLLFGNINKLKFYQSPSEKDKQKMEEFAAKLGITYLLDQKLNEISGGERQIVSICCSFIQDTEVIILDEPTSALDIKNQYNVLSILKESAIQEEKTIILSSHNPNHALYLDSEVYLLKNGKILDNGTASTIISPEKLKCIYGENMTYSKDLPYNEISFV